MLVCLRILELEFATVRDFFVLTDTDIITLLERKFFLRIRAFRLCWFCVAIVVAFFRTRRSPSPHDGDDDEKDKNEEQRSSDRYS